MFSRRSQIASLLLLSWIAAAVAAEPPPPGTELRTWTSADGKFQTRAALVEAKSDSAVLKKETGDTVTVPRQKLSRADCDYLDRQTAGSHLPIATENRAATVSEAQATPGKSVAPKTMTQREFGRLRLEFNKRLIRDAYLRQGKRDPAWDDAALKFLDEIVLYATYGELSPFCGNRKPATIVRRRAMGEAARKLGCDDPLVLACYLSTLPAQSWRDSETQVKPALEMLDALQSRHYPPLQVATAAREVHLACVLTHETRKAVEKILTDQVFAVLSAKEFPGIDRQLVFLSVRDALTVLTVTRKIMLGKDGRPSGVQSTSPNPFYDRLRQSKETERWLTAMILGEMEIKTGMGMSASKVPGGRAAFGPGELKQQWAKARRYLLEAWKLHPECPEAATDMIMLAAVDDDPAASMQLWFDRAVAAQFDWIPAYTAVRARLLQTGDVEAHYAFGRQCLQSGRYDTMVPFQFVNCLKENASLAHSQTIWTRAGVYGELHSMFRKYAEDPHEIDRAMLAAEEACCAYLADQMEDARQALDRADDSLNQGIVEQHEIDAESMIGRIYAMTGPLKAPMQAMQQAVSEGKLADAAKLCRQMLAKTDKADKAWPFLRNRGAALEIGARFAGGEWVDIQPEPDLAGWKAARGEWSVDAQGGLVGRLDARGTNRRDRRGMILLCMARIGTRFELRGHAEVIEPEERAPAFGAIVGYGYPANYWQCLFSPYDPSTKTGNTTEILCSVHRNSHSRPMTVQRSDDFRVIVYDGQVATTVGVPKEPDQLPYILNLEHDPPTEDTPFGVGATRDWLADARVSVRFTHLKLRKLSVPPVAIKAPEPE